MTWPLQRCPAWAPHTWRKVAATAPRIASSTCSSCHLPGLCRRFRVAFVRVHDVAAAVAETNTTPTPCQVEDAVVAPAARQHGTISLLSAWAMATGASATLNDTRSCFRNQEGFPGSQSRVAAQSRRRGGFHRLTWQPNPERATTHKNENNVFVKYWHRACR